LGGRTTVRAPDHFRLRLSRKTPLHQALAGGLFVVSYNREFLEAIGVSRRLEL